MYFYHKFVMPYQLVFDNFSKLSKHFSLKRFNRVKIEQWTMG